MSSESNPRAALAALLARPLEARLAAYLALRPNRSLSLEALSKIIDLRPEWIQGALRVWTDAGLPVRARGETWAWDDLGALGGEGSPALKAAMADHKAKFEIQEIIVFLESETASRRSRG